MKTSLYPNQRERAGRGGLSGIERAIVRARLQLSQAVGGVLESGLEAIGDRLSQTRRHVGGQASANVLEQLSATAQVHGHRLREVIERDRALIASSPDQVELAQAAVQVEAAERVSAQAAQAAGEAQATQAQTAEAAQVEVSLELDVPFVASASQVPPPPLQLCDEPIRTRTMAKLLAAQGHRERALSIYDYLLAKTPGDQALWSEAESVRAFD